MDKTKENKAKNKSFSRPCVYILRCGDGTFYTGWSNDFNKRLSAHRDGKGAKYTKGRGPLCPVYLAYFPDKISAMKREAAIKKMSRLKKTKLLNSSKNLLKKS